MRRRLLRSGLRSPSLLGCRRARPAAPARRRPRPARFLSARPAGRPRAGPSTTRSREGWQALLDGDTLERRARVPPRGAASRQGGSARAGAIGLDRGSRALPALRARRSGPAPSLLAERRADGARFCRPAAKRARARRIRWAPSSSTTAPLRRRRTGPASPRGPRSCARRRPTRSSTRPSRSAAAGRRDEARRQVARALGWSSRSLPSPRARGGRGMRVGRPRAGARVLPGGDRARRRRHRGGSRGPGDLALELRDYGRRPCRSSTDSRPGIRVSRPGPRRRGSRSGSPTGPMPSARRPCRAG